MGSFQILRSSAAGSSPSLAMLLIVAKVVALFRQQFRNIFCIGHLKKPLDEIGLSLNGTQYG
jgi:hypothetical protein